MEDLPSLQRLEVRIGEDLHELRNSRHLRDDRPLAAIEPRCLPEGRPREAARLRLQLAAGHRVVGLVAVAAFGAGPVRLRDPGLEREHLARALRRRRPASHLQQLRDILDVAVALRRKLRVAVHLAVAEAEAGLADVERVAIRVAGVVIDTGAEEAGAEAAQRAAHQLRHVLAALRTVDRRETGEEWNGVEPLRRGLIGEAAEQGRYLGAVAAGRGIALGIGFNELPHPRLRKLEEHGEGAPGGSVAGDLRVAGPGAVHIAEEVFARLHGAVHSREVDAPFAEAVRLGGGAAGAARGGLVGALDKGDHRAGLVDAVVALAGKGTGGGGEGQQRGGQDEGFLDGHGRRFPLSG